MKRKINCETARNFSVVKALEKLGHFPKKTTEKEAWFLSPFRSEAQASFKVSKTNNRWYDHGEGVGGNVIDLVCKILKCSIKETLDYLNNGITNFSFQQQKVFNDNEIQIDITKIQELTHPALIQYLSSRGISIAIAKAYCKEVWYGYKNAHFFAIGLQNHKNGWELRNKFYKNSSSPKSYTSLKNNHKQLIILEGMFDLLSLATIDEDTMNISDIIILNSIAFIKQIEKHISKYELVQLYLDNDNAGKKAAQYLISTYNHVIDKSSFYKNHKDLNDLLSHEKGREK
ncbi:toprim domain-containing protein [Mariniflexile aquimaris]|uniref:Toprim domain-containing protein n=1 Tax=Mariniflexile aquimaris TaxID=881009 RepID=A0ABW3BQP0_9FLAO